jgi:hypothetical protein
MIQTLFTIMILLFVVPAYAQAPSSSSGVKAHRADQIEVDPDDISNSSSDDLQIVLEDLDAAIGSGPGGGDNLGSGSPASHTAGQNLIMSGYDVTGVRNIIGTGNISFLSFNGTNNDRFRVNNYIMILNDGYASTRPEDYSGIVIDGGVDADIYVRYRHDQLLGGLHDEVIFGSDSTYTVYYKFGDDVLVMGNRIALSWESGNSVSLEHDQTTDVLEFKGAEEYHFDGPVSWVGDGFGARLEQELNLFEWPTVTPGKWAIYGKEDDVLDPYWYLENVVICDDDFKGNATDGDDNCPGTMTVNQAGGGYAGSDGYCDSFDDWGACYPVKNKQRIITDNDSFGSDNLGDHTATEDLDMDGYGITNLGATGISIDHNGGTLELEFKGSTGGYYFDDRIILDTHSLWYRDSGNTIELQFDSPSVNRTVIIPDGTGWVYITPGVEDLDLGGFDLKGIGEAGITYDDINDILEFNSALGGYHFDGPLTWAGDGLGSRLELGLNLFEWPIVTPGQWAIYAKETGTLDPEWYVENVVICTDDSDGSSSGGTCPSGMTGNQTGGSEGDGYCDSFDDWGSCYEVNNQQRILTNLVTEDLDMNGYGISNIGEADLAYDAANDILEFNGALGGYKFDGPLTWAGDGFGSRLELDVNLFEWPTLTDDKWAIYSKEDDVLQPAYYAERKLSCTDAYSGPDTCPGTMTANQTSTAGADGYCDSFDDWGSCHLVQDRQQVATTSFRTMERMIYIQAQSLTSATNWMGAKCVGAKINETNMDWCNDPITRITVPAGYEMRVDSISMELLSSDLVTTGGNEVYDCTFFINVSNTRDTDGSCNHPGDPSDTSSTCLAEVTGRPLAHLGVTAAISPDTWPRLVNRGEPVVFNDFDGDGDTTDNDLSATAWWRLQVDHRHECDSGSTNSGDACWNNADCDGGDCDYKLSSVQGAHNNTPFECIHMPPVAANVVYTLHKLETY